MADGLDESFTSVVSAAQHSTDQRTLTLQTEREGVQKRCAGAGAVFRPAGPPVYAVIPPLAGRLRAGSTPSCAARALRSRTSSRT